MACSSENVLIFLALFIPKMLFPGKDWPFPSDVRVHFPPCQLHMPGNWPFAFE